MKFNSFIPQAIVCLLISYLTYWSLIEFANFTEASYDHYIFVLIFGISILSYLAVSKIGELDKTYFMAAIMGSIVLRLIVFVGANFLIIYFNREQAVANVILFFILYLLFTIIETISLFKKVSSQ